MNLLGALASGVAGAGALTLLHEAARRLHPAAPRMDVLAMRGIGRTLEALGTEPPDDPTLHEISLGGDLVANGLYYSLVAVGRPQGALGRGALLGLLAGIGGVVLPGPFGLGTDPSNRTPATQLMTVAWYVVGGLAAATTYRLLCGSAKDPRNQALTSSQL